ncbi:MAG: hypothetical protein EHM18_13280 [Acidobacteria bacterium]|nr:MAG: hypothetical protein EHM18_13280 [Acidobacteriota bacterium]
MLEQTEFVNIGPKEAARLRRIGVAGLACASVLGMVMIYYQISGWARPLLFFLAWLGCSLQLQANARTSILLAARRVRRIDGTEEPELYVMTLRAQSRAIQNWSLFLAALVVTFVVMCT